MKRNKKKKPAPMAEAEIKVDKAREKNQDKSTWEGLFNFWFINRRAKYPYFLEWLKLKANAPKLKSKE